MIYTKAGLFSSTLASFSGLHHCPVFDCLQYTKVEGEEDLGGLVLCRLGALPENESWGPSRNILSKKGGGSLSVIDPGGVVADG